MSWINDVKNEIKNLDVSKKSLRKFGVTIGLIFLIVAIFFHWKNNFQYFQLIFYVIGFALVVSGIFFPDGLKNIYKIWMGFAFALGWFVSRLILIILFYFILTPIGIIAKLFGKEFLDLKFIDEKPTFWIMKKNKTDYEKLY
ncbi:MAG: SxtJ family membrane protein [Melioribacteraceae bacterium]|nr:SxtJ family membrane protein [Melioribacteraceae bacterium]